MFYLEAGMETPPIQGMNSTDSGEQESPGASREERTSGNGKAADWSECPMCVVNRQFVLFICLLEDGPVDIPTSVGCVGRDTDDDRCKMMQMQNTFFTHTSTIYPYTLHEHTDFSIQIRSFHSQLQSCEADESRTDQNVDERGAPELAKLFALMVGGCVFARLKAVSTQNLNRWSMG